MLESQRVDLKTLTFYLTTTSIFLLNISVIWEPIFVIHDRLLWQSNQNGTYTIMANGINPSATTTLWGTLNNQADAINDNQAQLLKRQESLNELIEQDTKLLTEHTQEFTNWKNDSSGYGMATNEELATGSGFIGSVTKSFRPYSSDMKASEMDAQQQNIEVIQERLDVHKNELKELSHTLQSSYSTENSVHTGADDVVKHYGGFMRSPIDF